MAFKFRLGMKAKDSITGFEGIIIARIEYLTGCQQYQLLREDEVDEKGKEITLWVDEYRIAKAPAAKKEAKKKRPSGPFKGAPTFDKP
jgi:hypothetical protein